MPLKGIFLCWGRTFQWLFQGCTSGDTLVPEDAVTEFCCLSWGGGKSWRFCKSEEIYFLRFFTWNTSHK